MQVTSLLSREETGHKHEGAEFGCGHDHEHAPIRLWQTLVGVVFVINAFIIDWIFDQSHAIAAAYADAYTLRPVVFVVARIYPGPRRSKVGAEGEHVVTVEQDCDLLGVGLLRHRNGPVWK